MRRFAPTLLLALPLVVALVPEAAHSTRAIDVELSRYASVDGTHGFQVKALGLNALIRDGKTVTVELTPKEAGTFEITCSEYCGRGHGRMRARLIVTPDASTQIRGKR